MRVLLTGFGSFGDVLDNPTARLALRFDGAVLRTSSDVIEVRGLSLPTSFARAKELVLAARDVDAIVMLGVAESASELRVELRGMNCDEARIADVDGATPRAKIAAGAPDALSTTIDAEGLVFAIAASGAPVRVSQSAGAYVCNHTLFEVLRRGTLPTAFVHLPPDPETTRVPRENAVRFVVLERAVAALLAALPGLLNGRADSRSPDRRSD